jgi:hydrogenase maturation protein HypF
VEGAFQPISPDVCVFQDCIQEMHTPSDRRFLYSFINCTNCGPRFTIITDIPYDRPNTTMASFDMCPVCLAEYVQPLDRRFHAQPIACPVCGPQIWVEVADNHIENLDRQARQPQSNRPRLDFPNENPLQTVQRFLAEGKVVAIKGLGGFHLACDATNPQAVRILRERKRRIAKPLAVMMASLDEIRQHCVMVRQEEEWLKSPPCPILLLEWKSESTVVREVAPGNRYLGVMLPYTPLHHLLLREVGRPLVMTSGNLSEEPIVQDNAEAWRRLRNLADWFLFHNREIYARYDDSVWFASTVCGEKG